MSQAGIAHLDTGGGGANVQQFDVDNGANVIAVANTVQVSGISGAGFVPSGIETHNGGGLGNDLFIEDRRWISQYIVDQSTTVGARGTFTTIQAAMDAAALAPQARIFIRPGTYTENLTLRDGVNISGSAVDGRVGIIQVIGNHTFTEAGSCAFEGVSFASPAGNTFTINPVGTDTCILAVKFCSVVNSAGIIFSMVPGPTAVAALGSANCNYSAGTNAFNTINNSVIDLNDCQIINTVGAQSLFVLDGNTNIVTTTSEFNSTGDVFDIISANVTIRSQYNFSTAQNAFVRFTAAGNVNAMHSIIDASDPSTNYVIGVGNYTFADQVLLGPAINVDPATTQIIPPWKPYATAGSSVTAIRGTSSFDSTQFTVTDGFVQISGAGTTTLNYTNVNTTPYVVLPTDQYLGVDSSGAPIQINLPDAPATGRTFNIKDRTGSANTNAITVTTVGGVVLIDGSATYVMNTQYAAINVLFDGTTYQIF